MNKPPLPRFCPCQPRALKKKNSQFDGNITSSSKTNAMRFSQLVRMTSIRNKCGSVGSTCTSTDSTVYISIPINAFGYYTGAPMGSGEPPRNTF
jgi:hypothetical protein